MKKKLVKKFGPFCFQNFLPAQSSKESFFAIWFPSELVFSAYDFCFVTYDRQG